MADVNYAELIKQRLSVSELDLSGKIEAVQLLDDATVYRHGVDTTNRLARDATAYSIAAEWSQLKIDRSEAEFMIDRTIDLITERVREREQQREQLHAQQLAPSHHLSDRAREALDGLEL